MCKFPTAIVKCDTLSRHVNSHMHSEALRNLPIMYCYSKYKCVVHVVVALACLLLHTYCTVLLLLVAEGVSTAVIS